ncbi:hypothetical protein D3C79_1007120 [compost metagenome]
MLVVPSIAKNDEDIVRIIKSEHVVRLTDLIRRRLPEGLNPTTLGRDKAQHLSRIVASTLGWSEEKREQELENFLSDTARIYR